MLKFMAGLTFLPLFPILASAQAPSYTFDVASIKPSDPTVNSINVDSGPGTMNISGAPVKLLIQEAFDVRDTQITGGPGWISADRFDIVAKVLRNSSEPEEPKNPGDEGKAMERQRERLRNLLIDRFRLKTHRETKELTVYVLTLGKNGPKFTQSRQQEESAPEAAQGKESDRPRGNFMRIGRGQVTGQGMPVESLVRVLSQQLGRTVIDKTGLKGDYDFTLEWTPDSGRGAASGSQDSPAVSKEPRQDTVGTSETGGPSLFAAVQEQLGLKLESQKAQVEMLVVDSIEKPSEN